MSYPTLDADYAITRRDDASTTGWWVRLFRPGERKPATSKLFSDSLNGGYDAARVAARAWRDTQRSALDIVQRKRDGNGHFVAYKRNTSGKIGVRLCRQSPGLKPGACSGARLQVPLRVRRGWTGE